MGDGLRKGSRSWLFDFQFEGERHHGDTGFALKHKQLAKDYVASLRDKLRKQAAAKRQGIKPLPETTCKELLVEWLEFHQGKHRDRVERDWRLHILDSIGSTKVLDVRTKDLETIRKNFLESPSLRNAHYADKIAAKIAKAKEQGEEIKESKPKGRTNRGANKLIRHLWLVLGWAVETERIPKLPCKPLEELEEQEPVKTFLRQDQVDEFFRLLDKGDNLHQRVAVRAMLLLALREDEALHLRWDGFSSDFSTYTPQETKTGENLALPVHESLRVILLEMPRQGEWVLPQLPPEPTLTKKGTPRKPRRGTVGDTHVSQFCTKVIKRIGRQMGVDGLTPHRMRGSCVTMMARNRANSFIIKKMGRWKRLETAEKYVQVVEDDLAAAQREVFGG